MTYDEMNDRLKENVEEQKQLMLDCKESQWWSSGERVPEHVNIKMQALFDEFDELWKKVKVIDNG